MPGPSAKDLFKVLNARYAEGGEVDVAEQMTVGTIPEGMREPGKAEEAFRSLVEAGQGFLGLEPGRRGTEAYRTGQALSNLPVLALPAAAVKGTGKAAEALKEVVKKSKSSSPEIKKSGKLAELEKELTETGGKRQGLRLQRAADEIPSLEDQFEIQALRRAFRGRKGYPYQGVMTMDPKDFQEFALALNDPLSFQSEENIKKLRNLLSQGVSFDEVPFLMMDKKGDFARIVGHEGRHRARALVGEKYPKTLVEVYPRGRLEMGADDEPMTATEWLRRFNEELAKNNRSVLSEDETTVLKLPDVYAKGGEVSTTDFIRKRQAGSPPEGEVSMAEEDMPSRSEQALRAYIEAANPRINIKKEPLRPGVAGAVRSRNPDQILLNSMMKQTPAKTEETIFHELEHSLDERGANPLGVISKSDGNPITTDNNYRFDILYNMGDKKIQNPDMKDLMDLSRAGDGKKNRLMMIHSFVKNQPLIEKFFGRSLDSAYFNPNMLKAQARYGTEGALFAEQIADLSALEQITGKSLTRDKEMRKLLFPDDRSAEVYDAITGYRQTRLDSKDLPPYTPISPEKKGMTNWLKDKLGMKEGGEVSETPEDDYIQQMMTGTPMSDMTPQRGLIPREIREAVDVPLDFLNLGIRGMAGAVAGPAYGLYQGITSEKFGTPEGVQEAGSEAGKMMQRITGVPKTETAKKTLEFLEGVAQEAKIPPMPQFLTTPAPGPGSANALLRSYELAETAPVGSVKLPGKEGRPVATPQMDAMGLYSPTEQVVMNLPQEKGTAQQMLAQISKAPGSRAAELRATGLEEYLKGKGNAPVTRQEIQDFLKSNPVQVNEVVLGKGMVLSPEAKRRMAEAENRMIEIDNQMAPYFENPQGPDIEPFYRLRGSLARKAAAGDAEAMAEIDGLNLPPDIKQLVLEFGEQKNEYMKYSKQARKMVKPEFEKYNIPGGKNAREIYLTLPGPTKAGVLPPSVDAQGNVIRSANAPSPLYMAPPLHRVSPEADTNRLAHIFLDDRMDAEGKKVLFVQELQSDWGKEGREKGFAKAFTPDQLKAEEILPKPPGPPVWKVTYPDGNQSTFAANSANEAIELAIQREGRVGLPPAPFVTSTEDWLNLALKRVIKEAVDTGAENVAFIKGEQAAKKYSLTTVLDGIEVFPTKPQSNTSRLIELKQKGGGIIPLFVNEKGVVNTVAPRVSQEFIGKPLSEIIGKELSEKVMSAKRKPSEGESISFDVEDIEVGGQGMKGFYDNILPKTAEKLLKRLGGGKIETIDLGRTKSRETWVQGREHPFMVEQDSSEPFEGRVKVVNKETGESRVFDTRDEADEYMAEALGHNVDQIHLGFKITPEMREMVKTQGLPKFAAGGEVTQFIKAHA